MTPTIQQQFFSLLIIIFLAISVTSCSDSTPENDEQKATTEETEQVSTTTEATKNETIDSTKKQKFKRKTNERVAPRTEYDSVNWVRILDVDATIVEDMRYATKDNFVEEIMYNCGACYLRPEVATAVGKAHKMLKAQGYGGLKMFDCYRPRPIQQKLWDKVPDARYVTPPWKGSMHNRGLAVDLTIIDSVGNQLDMGTKFDYFGKEGYHTYRDHSPEIQANRDLLKKTLYEVGFRHIRTEWWHYSYTKANYPISDWLWKCY